MPLITCSISLISLKVGSDEVNEDDSGGCASGDTKSSDDDDDDDSDDSEAEVKDDGSHGSNTKEKEEKELGVLSKPKKNPQFSGASESAATPPEEAPKSKFCRTCSSLMVRAELSIEQSGFEF